MNWSNWSEFAAMGGYGLYVWGSFGMCALVVTVELVSLAFRRRALATASAEHIADGGGAGA